MVWNVRNKKKFIMVKSVDSIADFCPDNKFYVSRCRDSSIHLWDWEKKKEITTFAGGTGLIV